MNEYNEILRKAAESPDRLSDSDIALLRRICREYPADAVAPALLLKYADSSLDEEERAMARARVSLYTGDPRTLITAIDPSGKGLDTFYPPLPADNRPSTDSAIDLFLETYGHQSPQEDALLERMIFNPVPDYAEQLARESAPTQDAPAPNSQDALIDAFLAKTAPHPTQGSSHSPTSAQPSPADSPRQETSRPKIHPTPEKQHNQSETVARTSTETSATQDGRKTVKHEADNTSNHGSKKAEASASSPSLLSQSLAKIFIKQGRYERAYEIIYNLSLNYPEKSVYFADQLRFLEKLIINQRFASGKQ